MAARARRIVIKIFVILAGVVTAVLLLRAILNYTTGKTLENYLAKAKAEGIPLSVKNMLPDCPDADNGEHPWRAAEALILIEKQNGPLMARITNEWAFEKPLAEKLRSDLAVLVEKNRKALDLAAEASARPCFRSQDWNGSLYTPSTSRLIHLIQVAKLLAADAALHSDRGDIKGALAECLVGLRLAWRIMDEPSLITTLIANADAKLMLFAFQRAVRGEAMEAKTLDAWMKEMDAGTWRARLNRCIPFERALGLNWGLQAIGGMPGDLSASLNTLSAKKGFDRFFLWLGRPVLKSQFIWVHKRFGELEKIAGEPYYEQNEFLNDRHLERVPWYYKPTGVVFPVFGSVFLKEASLEAMMLATKAGLACKIYRAKTGRYPENLEALVPDILPEVPIDPFTGKPFIFRRQGDDLFIYSLGSNRKDDGGRMGPITQMVMDKDDDWTWREKIK
jgi:hypothetical protein